MRTKKATTTMRVLRLPITRGQFVAMLKESFANSGFTVDHSDVEEEAEELLRLAAAFPADTVIEKRGTSMQSRRRAS